jgi:multiple sugar transport system permease protein
MTAAAEPPVRGARRGSRGPSPQRLLAYGFAILITLFMLVPLYLITISAIQPKSSIDLTYPRPLFPGQLSLETLWFFLTYAGVPAALARSLVVGLLTVVFALLLGVPAGYAIARYSFRGREVIQVLLVSVRAFPLIVLAIPMAVIFIDWGLYDTVLSVALLHTALALPFTVLITASVFIRVPVELEEAAMSLGTSRFGAVIRVVVPNSLPGIATAALFAFVLSWNEVFGAAVVTQQSKTLPALVVNQLSSSLPSYQFAGGFALTIPALVFIYFMRPYLFTAFRGAGH